jgi:hypothetical protein
MRPTPALTGTAVAVLGVAFLTGTLVLGATPGQLRRPVRRVNGTDVVA